MASTLNLLGNLQNFWKSSVPWFQTGSNKWSAMEIYGLPSSSRSNAAPAANDLSLASATFRGSGAMPQLVQAMSRSGSTNSTAARSVAATFSGVSTTAKKFIGEGGYFWNCGVFLWKVSTILEEIQTHLPDLYEKLSAITSHTIGNKRKYPYRILDSEGAKIYQSLPSISIDYGVSGTAEVPDGNCNRLQR